MSESGDTKTVQTVSVKLPAFNSKRPGVWLQQVEAEFDVAGVTREETKYSHVVRSLPTEAANRLGRVINPRPTTNPYTTVKEAILRKFTPTDAERLEAMLDEQPLGDMKPSEWAAELEALAPSDAEASAFFLKNLFLRRLPQRERDSLACLPFTSLDEFGERADKIWASGKLKSSSAAEVQATGRVARQNRATPSTHPDPVFCWRHRKYGDRANKCEGGSCAWPKNGPVGSSN